MMAALVLCGLVIIPTGCAIFKPSTQRQAVNTLFSVGESVDASYKAYLDLVVRKELSTNAVPKVASAYLNFQLVFNAATMLVANPTNAVAPLDVISAGAGVTAAINTAKGK